LGLGAQPGPNFTASRNLKVSLGYNGDFGQGETNQGVRGGLTWNW